MSEARERIAPFIDLKSKIHQPVVRSLYSAVARPLEHLLRLPQFNEIHYKVDEECLDGDFFGTSLRVLGTKIEISEADCAKIPKEGPTLVIANHPMGGLDGVVFGHILNQRREDSKLMVNYLLCGMPKMIPKVIAVDPFEDKDSARANMAPMKDAIKWLKSAHCLGTFPSGEVSSFNFRHRKVIDPKWNPITAKLALLSKATVVPVYFPGRNSLLFQFAGMIHPRLRTALLLREIVDNKNTTIRVKIGNPIPWKTYSNIGSPEEITDYFRFRTYMLSKRSSSSVTEKQRERKIFKKKDKKNNFLPIIEPVEKKLLVEDLEKLSPTKILFSKGNLKVIYAVGDEIPNLLREIGRLREYTFRTGNEGTGKSLDIDEFDSYYYHIILLDTDDMSIIGAYRAGKSHEILQRFGANGLYTRTLFKYKKELIDLWGPSIELGRSFIVPEHQRKFTSLSVLWQGIGAFVCRDPRYKMLFGPVSIDQTYNRVSRDLMVFFLKKTAFHPSYSNKVKAKHPPSPQWSIGPKQKKTLLQTAKSIEDVSAIISDIEPDNRGIPTLLRHYLKLNAQLLSFNKDPDFSNVLDGLILVDLTTADPKMVKHFMGKEDYAEFMEFHS
jgi:putative hemolysin